MQLLLPRPALAALVLTFVAALFGGCKTTETTPKSATAQATEEQAGEEYVTVQTTGSLLPRRVKAKDLKKEAVKVENGDSPTLQQMENNQWKAVKPRSN